MHGVSAIYGRGNVAVAGISSGAPHRGHVTPPACAGAFDVLKPLYVPAAGNRVFSLWVVYSDPQEPLTAHLVWAVCVAPEQSYWTTGPIRKVQVLGGGSAQTLVGKVLLPRRSRTWVKGQRSATRIITCPRQPSSDALGDLSGERALVD